MAAEGRGLPFAEAIDFLQGKVNLPTERWDDLRHGAHVRAFSVAGVTRDDMLADFRAAIEKARTQGTTLDEFRKDFDAIVDRTGWKFKARGATEEERRAWRARIIYKTNMRTSYMAGRYKQMMDPDVLRYRPWWQYNHSGALHPRQTHLALDGKVFAATDPIWRVYYPPNGFGCGCDVTALSNRQLKALGKTGPDPWPLGQSYPGKDPRTGEEEERFPGVDRGWEYNVGRSWLDGVVPQPLRKPLPPLDLPAPKPDLPPLPEPDRVDPAALLADDLPAQVYADRFLQAFGMGPGAEGYYRDRSGGIIALSQRLFEHRDQSGTAVGLKSGKRGRGQFALLLADAIQNPDEIWADWAQVASGVVLRRSYLKVVLLPDSQPLLVRFEWTAKGWVAVTGFDTTDTYLAKFRRGALLYRRETQSGAPRPERPI